MAYEPSKDDDVIEIGDYITDAILISKVTAIDNGPTYHTTGLSYVPEEIRKVKFLPLDEFEVANRDVLINRAVRDENCEEIFTITGFSFVDKDNPKILLSSGKYITPAELVRNFVWDENGYPAGKMEVVNG